MGIKRFNISLDEQLLQELDKAAKLEYASRSDFIRKLVVQHLQRLQNAAQTTVSVSDDELEAAYTTLRRERARRLAGAEIKKLRRQGH